MLISHNSIVAVRIGIVSIPKKENIKIATEPLIPNSINAMDGMMDEIRKTLEIPARISNVDRFTFNMRQSIRN